MVTAIDDNLFAPEIIADPYSYFGRLREQDPAHWRQGLNDWHSGGTTRGFHGLVSLPVAT